MSAQDDVLKAVDQYWRSIRDIHEIVDCWARPTVRTALIALENRNVVASKIIERRKNTTRKVYRLSDATAALSFLTDDTHNNRSGRLELNGDQS